MIYEGDDARWSEKNGVKRSHPQPFLEIFWNTGVCKVGHCLRQYVFPKFGMTQFLDLEEVIVVQIFPLILKVICAYCIIIMGC